MEWSSNDIDGYLQQMATQTETAIGSDDKPTHLVGIHTGGVWVANALNQHLKRQLPCSTVAASFYRDDFEQRGLKKRSNYSDLPASIDDCTIVLVDDVLMSGRTIRAALNELFDYGRPARVLLAVLFDIGQRELPIQADIVGKHVPLTPPERVSLHGPDPLTARLQQTRDITS